MQSYGARLPTSPVRLAPTCDWLDLRTEVGRAVAARTLFCRTMSCRPTTSIPIRLRGRIAGISPSSWSSDRKRGPIAQPSRRTGKPCRTQPAAAESQRDRACARTDSRACLQSVDRLLARPAEAADIDQIGSAGRCWRDWHVEGLTDHDGTFKPGIRPSYVRSKGSSRRPRCSDFCETLLDSSGSTPWVSMCRSSASTRLRSRRMNSAACTRIASTRSRCS